MSHKKIQGKVVSIGKSRYAIKKFSEVPQRGKKVGHFRIYKRGNFVYETYRARAVRKT